MEKTGFIIIGAGAVGLAIAENLAGTGHEVIVVEKNDSFGRETSSRNSEVIHAGFYYPTGSLKARLCVEGSRLTYEFSRAHDIPHRQTGKLLVANSIAEKTKVHKLFALGNANGVPGMRMLTQAEITALEPHARGEMGLYSPSTGIFDTHRYMHTLATRAAGAGATIVYLCEVIGIDPESDHFMVTVRESNGEITRLSARVVINAAGLAADRVAAMAGIDIDQAGYRLHLCKGEYFSVADRHRGKITHLVYPPPTPISLGVHGVLKLDGGFKLGPSAFYVDAIDYTVDPAHAVEFYEHARNIFPFLEPCDLQPDMAGIRPKLHGDESDFHDFIIRDETDRGLAGLINLIGIESPGLTASLAIARHVATLLAGNS